MSDNFEILVDSDATLAEASYLSRAVLAEFRSLGLITGKATAKCVLGGKGFRPGPAVPKLYKRTRGELRFWDLVNCGVAVRVGRDFNEWAPGSVCEGFTCPTCGGQIQTDSKFFDSLAKALVQWQDSGAARLRCPRCGKRPSVAQWECKPPLGCGNLSFRFWNWPPLDSASWKIDIVAVVQDITGHTIVATYGHF